MSDFEDLVFIKSSSRHNSPVSERRISQLETPSTQAKMKVAPTTPSDHENTPGPPLSLGGNPSHEPTEMGSLQNTLDPSSILAHKYGTLMNSNTPMAVIPSKLLLELIRDKQSAENNSGSPPRVVHIRRNGNGTQGPPPPPQPPFPHLPPGLSSFSLPVNPPRAISPPQALPPPAPPSGPSASRRNHPKPPAPVMMSTLPPPPPPPPMLHPGMPPAPPCPPMIIPHPPPPMGVGHPPPPPPPPIAVVPPGAWPPLNRPVSPCSIASLDDHRDNATRASSYTDLFPTYYSDADTPEDRIMLLTPFEKKVYMLYYQPSTYEFNHYSLLLQAAKPYEWYTWPGAIKSGHVGATFKAPTINSFKVNFSNDDVSNDSFKLYNQTFPRICASAALTVDDDGESCPHELEDDCDCMDRHEEYRKALEQVSLIYYVVFSTCLSPSAFVRSACSTPVFSVVRCGSRGAACAEVFYAAGVHGWSTCFAAVVRECDMGRFEEGTSKIERVKSLGALAEIQEGSKSGSGSVIKMLY